MCVNKRWITNGRGQKILVKCGSCPACLQEKAINRANRIRNTYASDGSLQCLFITLTYRNSCIPYILKRDIINSTIVREYLDPDIYANQNFEDVRYVPIYRDVVSSRSMRNGFRFSRHQIDSLRIPVRYDVTTPLPLLRNDHTKLYRTSVCYYPDLQNFFKRLRQNLKRKYGLSFLNFKYFACSEYGSTSKRAHFHILLFVPASVPFSFWQTAISEAWPFDGYNLTRRNIEIARDCASYVSGYLNKSASLPLLFKMDTAARQRHSYSVSFGVGKNAFTFKNVVEAVRKRDVRFDKTFVRDGVLFMERSLLPLYVIRRAFPKWKGYYRLTTDEIVSVLYRPYLIYQYGERCFLTKEDCHNIEVKLTNKRKLCYFNKIDYDVYVKCASYVYVLYDSERLKDFYGSVVYNSDYFEMYDNIKDLYTCEVDSDLSNLYVSLPKDFAYEIDPNKFRSNVLADFNMKYWHSTYLQTRDAREAALSQSNLHF